ncbi:efflux RND transporter periplasmic adaptor subunit [Marinicella litoralis]|uniref:CusB/HlyD membrane fusion family barrel-sandwich protein n=1 Tax=Marinicella litoralis TaxID=644220 RepID=A0A4R6XZ49_9GAMM|nr:efflux RND transporter periplasmic adaptor subunit [Marinicella litoralis]TDR23820.1 CusB/HlyD membrane fusion family barrel-sandwich protein [Marinicella litoralis]
MNKIIPTTCLTFLLLSCGNEEKLSTPVIQVVEDKVLFEIHAEGELEAVKSTPITAPATSRRPQTLAWIKPQFSPVKAGEVVAKFDGSTFQIEVDETSFEIQKLMYSMLAKDREIDNSKFSFGAEAQVIDYEYDLAKQFNIDDPLLYTKIEMIEAGDNEEFLKAKADHIDKVEENFEEKSQTEKAVLESSKQVQVAKLEMNNASLSALEVIAPHDGLFVLEPSWDGSLPEPGKSIFPGGKLASLPDLSLMQAKVYVPEVEAIGIKEGIAVKVTLHAFSDTTFDGTVSSISKTAQPKERDNPVKYFTVLVALDVSNNEQLKPGQRLDASIHVVEQARGMVVPIQTVFREQNSTWVYLQKGDQFTQQPITTGFCSSSLCTIEKGLNDGDVIALSQPYKSTTEAAL